MTKYKKDNAMRKSNWYLSFGVGYLAIALLIKVLNMQYNYSTFIQGFSIGLGVVLIVRGFLIRKKERTKS